jgi:hypothetical protein
VWTKSRQIPRLPSHGTEFAAVSTSGRPGGSSTQRRPWGHGCHTPPPCLAIPLEVDPADCRPPAHAGPERCGEHLRGHASRRRRHGLRLRADAALRLAQPARPTDTRLGVAPDPSTHACVGGRTVDFSSLAPRTMHTGRMARWTAREVPVTFVAFDLRKKRRPGSVTIRHADGLGNGQWKGAEGFTLVLSSDSWTRCSPLL